MTYVQIWFTRIRGDIRHLLDFLYPFFIPGIVKLAFEEVDLHAGKWGGTKSQGRCPGERDQADGHANSSWLGHLVSSVLEYLLDLCLILLGHVLQVQLIVLVLVVQMIDDLLADGYACCLSKRSAGFALAGHASIRTFVS